VVILADLGHKGGGREDFIIDRNGDRIAIKVGAKDKGFQTRNYEELSDWEEKRGEAEERRLLYVGMTRARDFLVLPVYWVKEKKGEKEAPEGSFLYYLQPYLSAPDKVAFGKWNEDMMAYDTNKLELEPGESAPFRSPLKPEMEGGKASRLVLSQRMKWKEAQEGLKKRAGMGYPITTATEQVSEFEKDDEWLVSPVTKGEGAIFGKLVHRLFEKLDWSQPGPLEKMVEIEGKALGASGSMRRKAEEMVRGALTSPLLQRVIKSGNYQKEVPFTYKDNGNIFEGVMDVVFREGDGLVVLDFKTDLVIKDDLNLKIEHFKPQAQVYSDAIRTIFGKSPKEVILFFLHLMEPVSLNSILS